jgi:subtilisin family serine protease
MRKLISFFVLVASASARVGEVKTSHRKLFVAEYGRAISGRYIVVLNPEVDNVLSVATSLLENTGASIEYDYDTAFKGFAVSGLVAKFLDLLLDDDVVEYVEEDQYVAEDQSIQTQSSPSNWALDRIDAPDLPMNNKYQYRYTGKGVIIFVLDTGVNMNHAEYSGRVRCGYSAISGEDCTDYRGHGSHVTGIAAGSSVGVAKGATVYSVKVLDKDGNGSVSGVIAGINYVAKQKQNNPTLPMVASEYSA